ncbi:hypothetical protein HanRHA438_Chr03g0127191 [Helianthus annuus]|uniref:Uncharacterized protein n=1 Tax=Helianthus annuus TaxID=4232 RepID=A0A251T0X0_HELAN|nr:hypothetical protein HanXRQr2_Chr03g0115331 [Helianthus annuus]KAJ0593374.1 hypothetical protein HanHA300_Chr03g0096281 [Helianthus annuus]KAJ0608383.1 hypothetical protein HanHA89_Chr03g0107951 [Helianthus annuus]KAJ0768447.1 hypothetical protein HanLR1_Chr03g0101321 [Helianthus annuus]KAJ0774198.1 hypothetical protein HanOQP8_Chr03g0108851 [Helianthus annuus]
MEQRKKKEQGYSRHKKRKTPVNFMLRMASSDSNTPHHPYMRFRFKLSFEMGQIIFVM